MAVPGYLQEQLYNIRTEANAVMARLEAGAAADMARFINDALRLFGEALDAGNITGADSILVAAEIVIDQISAYGADVMTRLAGDVFDVSLRSQTLLADQFATLAPRQLTQAALAFRADYRPDLLSEGHRLWYEQMSQTLHAEDSLLRRAFIEHEVFGDDLTGVARRLVEAGGDAELPSDYHIDAMRKAKRFIRTESTRVDTATSVGFSESIGIKKFLNVGVGDSRQSEICEFASEQEAMPLADWNRLRFQGQIVGAPPRHPHCRCGFMGVFEGFEPTDDLLIEAGVIEEGDRL